MSTPTNKKITACIYARVSSTGDRQDTARQVEDLTAYAKANNITIARTFTEKASGRKKREDRPVLNECLLYCIAQKIDVLLVSELSRLGRNAADVLNNVNICKEAKVNIYFQKEQLSLFLPDGKPHPFLTMLVAVLGAMAEMEADNIRYRLQSGLDKYIRDGGKVGRKQGYTKPLADYERDYPAVFKELRRPNRESYDRIARICQVSKVTVITCAKLLGLTRAQQSSQSKTPASQKPTKQKSEQ